MSKTEKRILWEKRVSAYKASGLTQMKWCEENDISIHQLGYWLKKFRSENLTETTSHKWLPIKVDHDESVPSSSNPSIVVSVGKAKIEVTSDFDPSLLANVVKALSNNVQ